MEKTILVVEDDPRNLKLFTDLLKVFKYNTIVARNGKEAIEIAQNNFNEIDLILMDLQMPVLDGLTAAKILKKDENTKHIKIIALTAFAMKDDEKRVKDSGCDGYITKPINITSFRKYISLYLEGDGFDE